MEIGIETEQCQVEEERWRAVLHNDASFDGAFFYAVKTTGIFCRPSCKSKPPKRENIRFFPNAGAAAAAGFRPCKRCRPTGDRSPTDEWIEVVAAYIDRHYSEPLTLERLAEIVHGSPYHLHRTFKQVKGLTPAAYIRQVRIGHAKRQLAGTDRPIADVGHRIGLPNTPYFITLFKKATGLTPASYRQSFE